jgi:hypothetical protein
LAEESLVAGADARRGSTRLDAWLSRSNSSVKA